jgi:hypothetical protein
MREEETSIEPEKPEDLSEMLLELKSKGTADTNNVQLSHEEKKARIESFRQNTEERKVYARESFNLMSIYLGVVAIFLFLVGLECFPFHFSDTVIITLLTTTTTTVIGIFLLVMQYLFRKGGRSR